MQQSTAEMLLFNLAGKKPCECLLECCISLHVDGEGGAEKREQTKVVFPSVVSGGELGICYLCC